VKKTKLDKVQKKENAQRKSSRIHVQDMAVIVLIWINSRPGERHALRRHQTPAGRDTVSQVPKEKA